LSNHRTPHQRRAGSSTTMTSTAIRITAAIRAPSPSCPVRACRHCRRLHRHPRRRSPVRPAPISSTGSASSSRPARRGPSIRTASATMSSARPAWCSYRMASACRRRSPVRRARSTIRANATRLPVRRG
jgi:hypothetical protein